MLVKYKNYYIFYTRSKTLYIDWKKAFRLQNILFTICFESKNIRETIIQYNKCCDIENEENDTLMVA